MTKKQRKRKKKIQMRNKRLIKKYYWLKPLSWNSRYIKDYDYSWIEWGWCPGWDKTFGQMYMDELGAAIKEDNIKNFRILQIKEKFGQARLYCNIYNEKIDQIIQKYEFISENICMNCGCESPMLDDGWLYTYCFDCYKKICRRREEYSNRTPKTDEEIRKTYNDITVENDTGVIPETYTIRKYTPNDGHEDIIYDISDTVKKIRKRISTYERFR